MAFTSQEAVRAFGAELRGNIKSCQFNDFESFTSAHRKWVQDAMEKTNMKRGSRWTESIAVGRGQFVERKKTMGVVARGRSIRGFDDNSELRETQSSYNAIFNPENCDIDPK